MKIWQAGFEYSFEPSACALCKGRCCVGESGNIFANPSELEALRAHFGLSEAEFSARYLRKVGARYSFKEFAYKGGFACIFFDKKAKNCSVYELRPKQCRSFPFWEYFKKHKEELEKECMGVCF